MCSLSIFLRFLPPYRDLILDKEIQVQSCEEELLRVTRLVILGVECMPAAWPELRCLRGGADRETAETSRGGEPDSRQRVALINVSCIRLVLGKIRRVQHVSQAGSPPGASGALCPAAEWGLGSVRRRCAGEGRASSWGGRWEEW